MDRRQLCLASFNLNARMYLQPTRQTTAMTYPAEKSPWNEDMVAKLKHLWVDEELSAGQIAQELGHGITRNAVLGKAHRIGLSNTTRRPRPEARAKRPRRPKTVGIKSKVVAEKPFVPRAADIVQFGTPFNELKSWQCKWIDGAPTFDAPACGHRVAEGKPYCPSHCDVAYMPPKERPPRPQAKADVATNFSEFMEAAA
jgi:GcrA cell cycle regulator